MNLPCQKFVRTTTALPPPPIKTHPNAAQSSTTIQAVKYAPSPILYLFVFIPLRFPFSPNGYILSLLEG